MTPAVSSAPCTCQAAVFGMATLARLLGYAGPHAARSARKWLVREGVPHLRRGKSLLMRAGTWHQLADLAEECAGDWGEAVRRLKRQRRDARREAAG